MSNYEIKEWKHGHLLTERDPDTNRIIRKGVITWIPEGASVSEYLHRAYLLTSDIEDLTEEERDKREWSQLSDEERTSESMRRIGL